MHGRLATITLLLAIASPIIADNATAPEAPPKQSPLILHAISLRGGELHLDASLIGEQEAIAGLVQAYFDRTESRRADADRWRRKHDQIAQVMDGLFGDTEPAAGLEQMAVFSSFVRLMARFGATDFYVVDANNAKAHLRIGGTLPHTTYDPETNRAQFRFAVGEHFDDADARMPTPADAPDPRSEWVIPISNPDDPVAQVRSALENLALPELGTALHEAIELRIVTTVLPRDPHWRWFSDGFATALAMVVLERVEEHAEADAFHQSFDPAPFADGKADVNLRYWLASDFDPQVNLPFEKRLNSARYALSYAVAKRVLDEHGPEVFARIIAHARQVDGRPTSDDLVSAIEAATGEPFAPRLLAYQSFESAAQGAQRYGQAYIDAKARGEWHEALANLLRLIEIRAADQYQTLSYLEVARLLHRLDRTRDGLEVLNHQMATWSKRDANVARALRNCVLVYAMECGDLSMARDTARQQLELEPGHVGSLIVQLDERIRAGQATPADAQALLDRLPADADPRLVRQLRRLASDPIPNQSAD